MKKIAILGSGSSSLAAVMKLVEYPIQLQITVIDFAATKTTNSGTIASGSAIKTSAGEYLFSLPPLFETSSASDVVLGSSAFGGWAEAWGGTIVPLSSHEIVENGMTLDEYSSNELAIRSLLKGKRPDFRKNAKRVVSKLLNSKVTLDGNFRHQVELSDLALSGLSEDISEGCNQCGMCLLGCPGEHIFKPSIHWRSIETMPNIDKISGVWIKTVRENKSWVEINIVNLSGEITSLHFDYVFCGLGAIQTAALMTRSGITDLVSIQDSQLIVTPFIDPLLRSTGTKQSRIGLSELFMSSRAPIAGFNIFSQLYGASDALTKMIYDSTPMLKLLPQKLVNVTLSRLGIAMQFLDSNHSGTLEVTSFDGKSEVKMVKNSLNRLYLKSFSSFTLLRISFIPLFFLSRFYKVGDGYHFGGSFPFGKLNKGNFSDSFGRPNGLSRISLVDSSTMTSINAKPNTFNTMVKARIVASRVIDEKII